MITLNLNRIHFNAIHFFLRTTEQIGLHLSFRLLFLSAPKLDFTPVFLTVNLYCLVEIYCFKVRISKVEIVFPAELWKAQHCTGSLQGCWPRHL